MKACVKRLSAGVAAAAMWLAAMAGAGSLEPTEQPMKSLQDIYDQTVALYGKLGGDTNAVAQIGGGAGPTAPPAPTMRTLRDMHVLLEMMESHLDGHSGPAPDLARVSGELDPTAPPTPTMRTLRDIWLMLEAMDAKIEGPVYPAAPWKTGQSVSYRAGDDGDLQRGFPWPVPRFTDHGNGTVTDNLTGLMWAKNTQLPNLKGAYRYVRENTANLTLGGHSDWRMPNIRELWSLMVPYRAPALPQEHPFVNVLLTTAWYEDYYWTTTGYISGMQAEIDTAIGMYGKHMGMMFAWWKTGGYSSQGHAWPVRGGQ